MEEKENYEILLERISWPGISKKLKKLFPHIAKQYLIGKPVKQVEENLKKNNKAFAGETYRRLDYVKTRCLEKIVPFFGEHPQNFKENYLFADILIRYCIGPGKLEKELDKIFNKVYLGEDKEELKDSLDRRYKQGERCDVRNALKILGSSPILLYFADKNISNNKKV